MRRSRAFIPTTKESPSDAVLASHIYLARAGFVTQVSAGLYNFLPLGKRVLTKIQNIVNEEMERAGAQEVDLSFVTPSELWEESGRLNKFGKELLRFKDRKNNDFVLGPTHEEMMVNLVKNRITSYKQLPINLYQIKTKFRDEARPRFGLMRGREFLMKDAYSFHATTEDLNREFETMEATYKRILERLDLDFRIVEADSGAIGGSGSKELMVIADSGEDTIAVCSKCEYGANVETATRGIRKDTTELKNYNSVRSVVKRLHFEEEDKIVLFFLRACDELQEVKAVNSLGALDISDLEEAELEKLGLTDESLAPLNLENIEYVFDRALQEAEDLNNIDLSTLNEPLYYDIYSVQEGDACPECSAPMTFTKGIEVGHIFKLGTTYSKALKAEFLNEKGQGTPFEMGTYGMGISRLVASVIEQNHDEKGCVWTKETAPYMVNIMVSNIKDEEQMALGEKLYTQFQDAGVEVVLDDRKDRFGFKMKDAELIGFPYTLIIGKELVNGNVQIFERATCDKEESSVETVYETLIGKIS